MTEPVPEKHIDPAVELDEIFASILFWYGTDDLATARERLRVALMFAWYDGQSAGLNAARADFVGRANPWIKPDKSDKSQRRLRRRGE